ncbi:hypothetical protein FCOIX_12970 [Fusarium coicis]|nr:hypothetical protein FCOIX_12970 [Fusarium coicis]
MPESQTEEQWLKSWDGPKGNITAWITNNIANWSETMGEGGKKRLIDEGNLLMEESSRRALKQHAADNKDLPTHDDPSAKASDELVGIFEMTRLEEAAETSADTASDQTTEENDLPQADKFSELGIIQEILPHVYEKTETSQRVADAHENSKRKDTPTISLNQQDHELPPTTEVSKTNEPPRPVTELTPEERRYTERGWNRFRDYLARQDMLGSALNQQDDQHSPPLKRINSDPRVNAFANWVAQRHALRERGERIARDRGYGIKWTGEKARLFPLDRAIWVTYKDMYDCTPYGCWALLAIEDNDVTAGLEKHLLIQIFNLDITRNSMNVSIRGQSDMRTLATIISTLAPDEVGQDCSDGDEPDRDAESQGVQVNGENADLKATMKRLENMHLFGPKASPESLSVMSTVVVATFKAFEKLDNEKYKEGWDAVLSCEGVLMDLRARDVYLRETLPKIESEGVDGWKKTCDEWILEAWILKAKTGAR